MIIRREKMKRSWLLAHKESVTKAITLTTGVRLPGPDGSVTHGSPVKLPLANADRIKLAKDIINSDVIYDEQPQAESSSKRVVKEMNRFIKLDQLRRHKPNPYAKYYLQETTLVNGLPSPKDKSGQPQSPHPSPAKTKIHSMCENKVEPKLTRQNRVAKTAPSPPTTPKKDHVPNGLPNKSGAFSGYKIPKRKLDEQTEQEEEKDVIEEKPVLVPSARRKTPTNNNKTRTLRSQIFSDLSTKVLSLTKLNGIEGIKGIKIETIEEHESGRKHPNQRRFHFRNVTRAQQNCSYDDTSIRASAANDVDMRQSLIH
jgi:hypothetical protein